MAVPDDAPHGLVHRPGRLLRVPLVAAEATHKDAALTAALFLVQELLLDADLRGAGGVGRKALEAMFSAVWLSSCSAIHASWWDAVGRVDVVGI